MPLFSGRKFKVSLMDELRTAWLHLPWPSPGRGEPDDATRGNPFFRSYGTKVTRVSPEWDGAAFRTHGQTPLGNRIRSLGQIVLPQIMVPLSFGPSFRGRGINGQIIAAANPNRIKLFLRLDGPSNTLVFLSGNQFIMSYDYQLDFSDPSIMQEFASQSIVYAACSRANVSIFVAEEESM